MTHEQQSSIKKLTGYSLDEIVSMSRRDFVMKIARLQASTLSRHQYIWLEQQRNGKNITKDLLDIFKDSVVV